MINFITLQATDIEKTAQVFRALNIAFEREQHGDGPVHLVSTNSRLVLEIYPAKDVNAAGVMIGLTVPDLTEAATLCDAMGVTIDKDIASSGAFRRMIVSTPEGAQVFVQESDAQNG